MSPSRLVGMSGSRVIGKVGGWIQICCAEFSRQQDNSLIYLLGPNSYNGIESTLSPGKGGFTSSR